MSHEFISPDWNASLDVEERIALMPSWVTIKGMFFQSLIKQTQQHKKPLLGENYVSFKSYPAQDYMRLSIKIVGILYPDLSLREGLRRLGQSVYPTLLQSMIGKVVFGALGNDVVAVMKLAPKGYALASKVGKAGVREISETHAILAFEEFFGFYDCYHIGVVEGAILACGKKPQIQFRIPQPGKLEMLCRWS
jgi:uncharacterized protein (TIGR02265 family)